MDCGDITSAPKVDDVAVFSVTGAHPTIAVTVVSGGYRGTYVAEEVPHSAWPGVLLAHPTDRAKTQASSRIWLTDRQLVRRTFVVVVARLVDPSLPVTEDEALASVRGIRSVGAFQVAFRRASGPPEPPGGKPVWIIAGKPSRQPFVSGPVDAPRDYAGKAMPVYVIDGTNGKVLSIAFTS